MQDERLYITHQVDDLRHPALDLLDRVKDEVEDKGVIIFLNGNLATGKTAFVQEFADLISIDRHIQSPTFTLMKSYSVDTELAPDIYKMVHIDAYRLEPHHNESLHVERFLDEPGTVVFIEWPTAIELDNSLCFGFIDFEILSEETRRIKIRYTK